MEGRRSGGKENQADSKARRLEQRELLSVELL